MAKIKRSPKDSTILMNIDKQIKAHNIKYVRFEQFDLYGVPRSKTVPISFFQHYIESGLNFYGGILTCDVQTRCAPDTGLGAEVTYGDACTIPDLSTFQVLPWVPNTARIIVDPYWYDGTPVVQTPRLMLKNLLKEFDQMGYIVRLGYEFEFYLFDNETLEPAYGSQPIFVTQYNNFDIDYMYDLMDKLQDGGYRIITQNSEQGPGQQEINLTYRDGLDAIDEAQSFKYAIKEISLQHGYLATFMTKPMIDKCASGAHVHISLIDKITGENVFRDDSDPDGLSELCKNAIAGILKHAPANTIFAAPTVNCYKRYRTGVCAPTTATWGLENRSVGIRVKGVRGSSTHIETRLNCSAASPYLTTLSTLTALMLGLKKKLTPPDACRHDVWADSTIQQLPATMEESLEAFNKDVELQEAYGSEFVKLVRAMKNWDMKIAAENCSDYGTPEFKTYISDWELAEFREIL
ncbi:MAG: glnA3 [Lachnospiraceae bacterium]|jgi:glutamine synthetase|nr:glnA3 [Lachnospiraceae bacterium]